MARPVRVLGFDPGLYVPSFAELDMDGRFVRVRSVNDKKAIDSNLDPAWRAHHIASVIIRHVVAAKEHGCYVVGIEGPAYGYKLSASIDQLARCRQALYDACVGALDDFVYVPVAPASRCTAIGLKSTAPKADVVAQVQRVFNVNLNPTNRLIRESEADAIAIAAAALGTYKRRRVGA